MVLAVFVWNFDPRLKVPDAEVPYLYDMFLVTKGPLEIYVKPAQR